ncbi:hypothetical protein GCM10027422_00460 [Hymenobacter arcticus]
MNLAILTIQLFEEYICIGATKILPKGRPVDALIQLLGPVDRVLPLYHKGVLQSLLYIYDQLGLRFWTHAGVIGEVQVVLETGERDVFPVHSFSGKLVYRGQLVPLPMPGNLLMSGQLPGFVRDDDAARWHMIAYEAQLPPLRYYAIVHSVTGNVQSISVM